MEYGDRGSDVKEVQQALLDRGFSLKRYGADGALGDETWEALEQFAKTETGGWKPEVPESVLTALCMDPTPTPAPFPPIPDGGLVGAEIVDLRGEQSDPSPKSKVVSGHTVIRNPSTITGIVLHQTATPYGVSQQQIDAAGGDRDLALHRRALGVACHAMGFRDGVTVISNPIERYIYASNGQNSVSVSTECEGRYAGLMNKPDATTWGGEPQEVTGEIVVAGRAAIAWLVREGRKLGCPIEFVWAHRQSSASRQSDPGEELWRRIVLDWAVPVLGLKTQPGRVWGDGRPIPVEWDPDGVGSY